jgi:hypothetical protein
VIPIEKEGVMLSYVINEDVTARTISVTFERSSYEQQLNNAIEIAKREGKGVRVQFEFNGRTFVVCYDTNAELMYRDFWLPFDVSGPVIGPYPDPTETKLHRQLALDRGSNFARALIN